MTHRKTITAKQFAAAIAVAAVPLAAYTANAGGAIANFDPAKPVATPAEKIDYQNINPAIRMGAAWGDRGQGTHGTFGKFPPEFITPYHTHTGAYHGIVISGVMTNPFEGEKNPPKMGPGSYWYVPAKAVHATACVSKAPCQFYFHAESAFDFKPVE